MIQPIYLDYNATTPHAPEVIEAMRPFFETEFGNPSSAHWYAIRPKQAVEEARRRVAGLLGCRAGEVIFTSGGTESNNQAIKSFGGARFARGNHIITSVIEHPAVLEVCRMMERYGFSVTYLPVDSDGRVDPVDVAGAIVPKTILISIMHANNEVGTLQPIAEIAGLIRDRDILLHTDAAQSAGKIPTRVNELGVDLLSVAGHKLYAPKGIGALYVRNGLTPERFFHGAGQEMGLRAGTENVLEIVGLGKACEIAERDLNRNTIHMCAMRDRLEAGLSASLADIRFNGHREERLPNTASVSFTGLEANRILEEIGLEVAASAGAACHSDRVTISHVLEAMRIPEEWAKGTLRFTTGRMTTADEIDRALEVIIAAVKKLRRKGDSG
jgi:cysteine desulfurase